MMLGRVALVTMCVIALLFVALTKSDPPGRGGTKGWKFAKACLASHLTKGRCGEPVNRINRDVV
jgi:hypothetical protein